MSNKRNYPKQLTLHHRKPVSVGGSNVAQNISYVTRERHEMYHTLFGSGTVQEVLHELNTTWLDQEVIVVALSRRQLKLLISQFK